MNYVNSICGWQFPEITIKSYLDAPRPQLLTMDFDFPCQKKCNLKCSYCFIETDERELELKNDKHSEKLNVDKLKTIFTETAKNGCKSAKLVGDQEPFLENGLLEFLNFVSEELEIWVVIFTNGLVLANDEQCLKIHGFDSNSLIAKLKKLRVSIMLKFHSFSNYIENNLVKTPGYAEKRNIILQRFIEAGFNDPPIFKSAKEQMLMTGVFPPPIPNTWTRLGLESVLTPQCLPDIEDIYRLKTSKRLYIDLDPPVPVGMTRSEEWRRKRGLAIPKEQLFEACLKIYRLNKELGIPFLGASPYFGGLPCSQLPYGLYVNSRGRMYPCCGCPDKESGGRSDFLGNVNDPQAISMALELNPYRIHYKKYGFAYDTPPFNSPSYPGYGVYHGCPYRDRAGDILPKRWEMKVQEFMQHIKENKAIVC